MGRETPASVQPGELDIARRSHGLSSTPPLLHSPSASPLGILGAFARGACLPVPLPCPSCRLPPCLRFSLTSVSLTLPFLPVYRNIFRSQSSMAFSSHPFRYRILFCLFTSPRIHPLFLSILPVCLLPSLFYFVPHPYYYLSLLPTLLEFPLSLSFFRALPLPTFITLFSYSLTTILLSFLVFRPSFSLPSSSPLLPSLAITTQQNPNEDIGSDSNRLGWL